MPTLFRISVHFLQPYCHARANDEGPEWPPSPLRVFQALVNAAAARWNERQSLVFAGPALRWFETIGPPEIRCAIGRPATTPYRLYVRDNIGDLDGIAWSKGTVAATANKKTEKDVLPTCLEGSTAHYIYQIEQSVDEVAHYLDVLRLAARSMTHLGWGVDMIAADADLIEPSAAAALSGEHWVVAYAGPNALRCPRVGSLDQLLSRHHAFLHRIEIDRDGEESFNPVPPLRAFRSFSYRRSDDPAPRPHVVFKLLDENDDTYRHPHSKLIHIAGMVRHLAIDALKRNPPPGLADPVAWVERYVAGHRDPADKSVDLPHAQLSYLPLPSVGHHHTDPGVRRVMIAAPVGDDAILEHLCRYIDGLPLEPEKPEDLRGPVFLHRAQNDIVSIHYTRPKDGNRPGYTSWASFTPVILPGHDDHKPEKTRKLIEKALAQSGIDQPCEFQWSAFSQFAKSYSAHKYDKSKRLIGYIRPNHLLNLTAVHVCLIFAHPVPGPITLGAGRHCGFGLMAALR